MLSIMSSADLTHTKGFGVGVVIGQVPADSILQRARAAMTAPTKLLLRQVGEPALHLVDPGRVRRREVQVKTRMSEQPAVDERRLVGGVVVQNEVDVEVQ